MRGGIIIRGLCADGSSVELREIDYGAAAERSRSETTKAQEIFLSRFEKSKALQCLRDKNRNRRARGKSTCTFELRLA